MESENDTANGALEVENGERVLPLSHEVGVMPAAVSLAAVL